MENKFHFFTKLALILVYLVIIAGAFVRMTGSGMGCPDWPKCFGFYIPPTEKSQILFKANSDYSKGQMILYNEEELLVAKSNFRSEKIINMNNFLICETIIINYLGFSIGPFSSNHLLKPPTR